MSQAGRPRPRHTAFRVHVDAPIARHHMAKALDRLAADAGIPEGRVRLTRFDAPYGIASTDHRHDAALRAALPGLDRVAGRPARLETLSSSGTIKTLTDRLGVLAERGPRPKGGKPDRAARRQGPGPGPERTAARGPAVARASSGAGGPAGVPGRAPRTPRAQSD